MKKLKKLGILSKRIIICHILHTWLLFNVELEALWSDICTSMFIPFPKRFRIFTTQRRKSFEIIVGKGENAGNQHFLLFPQFFSYLSKKNIWKKKRKSTALWDAENCPKGFVHIILPRLHRLTWVDTFCCCIKLAFLGVLHISFLLVFIRNKNLQTCEPKYIALSCLSITDLYSLLTWNCCRVWHDIQVWITQ